MTAPTLDAHTAARALAAAGLSVVPPRPDGTKAPLGAWKRHQTTPATPAELDAWYATGHQTGVGVVTGAVSGNLEMLELEGRAITEHLHAQLRDLAVDSGLGDLWNTLITGYCEWTPSGGLHFLYRLTQPPPANTKLARRAATADELEQNPADRIKVLIETRGEGGYVVVAPSAGATHPTGKAWRLIQGGPATQPPSPFEKPAAAHGATGTAPGEDYNARTTWPQILEPHGWTPVHTAGEVTYWRRPGKNIGISATTGYGAGDWLYVFTTSTELDAGRTHTKFGTYTALNHGGDHSKAASALRAAGYGTPAPEPAQATRAAATGTVGNLATVHHLDPGARPQLRLVDGPAETMQRSEDGHAQALIATFGERMRYSPARGRWLGWDGQAWRWQPEDGGLIREYAKVIARAMPEGDTANITHKRKALSAAGTSGCLRQARTDPRVEVDIADLDADPWKLNTPGGIVDLRTGHITPADPAALHTRITAATPDFDRTDPAWDAFLADTFGDDTHLRDYVQRLAGLAVIGTVLEQILPFWFGPGANGKSTLLEALMHALRTGDNGYAIAAPAEMLMVRKHPEHPAELAQLAGARLVVCSELEDGQRLAEARVKQLTGRDSINARFLYGQPFTFTPSHTIILAGNYKPVAKVGGPALWRRLRAVPFAHVVAKENRDPNLGDKLAAAAPIILAWAVRGASDYQTHGLGDPTAVKNATRDYEADQDTVGRFVDDACHLMPGSTTARVWRDELRRAYETWCSQAGEEPATAKRFVSELRDRFGVDVGGMSRGRRYHAGVMLITEEVAGDDSAMPPIGGQQELDQ